jgi:hypothetical protein
VFCYRAKRTSGYCRSSLCVHMMISELCSLLHIQSQAVRFDLLMTFMTILIFP